MRRTCSICLRTFDLEEVIVSGGNGPVVCGPCYQRRWLGRRLTAEVGAS